MHRMLFESILFFRDPLRIEAVEELHVGRFWMGVDSKEKKAAAEAKELAEKTKAPPTPVASFHMPVATSNRLRS